MPNIAPYALTTQDKVRAYLGLTSGATGSIPSGVSARVYSSVIQQANSGEDLVLEFDSENYDTDDIHDVDTDASRLTAQHAGTYTIQGQADLQDMSGTEWTLTLLLNGEDVIGFSRLKANLLFVETVYQLEAGDYVELVVNQASGGEVDVQPGTGHTWFAMNADDVSLALPTTDDDLLGMLITGVTDYIESYCGRKHFMSKEYTDEEYDTGTTVPVDKIFLKHRPVTELAAVEYRTGTFSNPSWVAYDPNYYTLYDKAGYVLFPGGVVRGVGRNLRFSYTAGYLIDWTDEYNEEAHTLPADLSLAATEMVASVYNSRRSKGISQESTEGQSITYKEAMSDSVKETLDNYKNYPYGY